MPSISALAAFAATGLALAISFLLVSTLCGGALLLAQWRRMAAAGLRRQPGAFLARELASVERRLRRHGTAALLFLVSFGILVVLGRRDVAVDLPAWMATATVAVAAAAGIFAVAKAVALLRYRRRLRELLEADLRVAERLEEVQRRGHRVFHAVPVGDQVIDHVIVGPIGIFAAQVVLPERAGATNVTMTRGCLIFGPDGGQFRLPLVVEAFALLAKQLGRLVGHPIKVVPTLIAPGCKVSAWDDDRYLLTNEQNCVTLVGWKDSAAYLMDDEVARISEWLEARCQAQQQPAWRSRRSPLHACVTRPALL